MNENLFFVDYYEYTVGEVNQDFNYNPIVTQSYFYRKCPYSKFIIPVGQHRFIEHIERLNDGTLTEQNIAWLRKKSKGGLSEEFLEHLYNFKFKGEITAVPTGLPMFPNEPIVNVTDTLIDTQILETYLLHDMNTMSPVATKAARIKYAIGPRSLAEFGARRSANPMMTAEAAFIGGAGVTSLVEASRVYGMDFFGTMSHAYVQSRWDGVMSFSDSELLAYRQYAKRHPDNSVFLVDTYDTIQGTKNAIIVALEMRAAGHELVGIRLDSGDMAALSQICRVLLDAAGFPNVKIFLSDGIDDLKAWRLITSGADVDGFGCGTNLVHPPPLGGVYKLVQIGDIHYMKFTDNPAKRTLPGRRQVYRKYSKRGFAMMDLQALWDEDVPEEYVPLHKTIWDKNGAVEFPDIVTMQKQTLQGMATLSSLDKAIYEPKTKLGTPYCVLLSPELTRVRDELVGRYMSEYGKEEK